MFDLQKTMDLAKGALLDPEPTWDEYLDENNTWQDTALELTLPLVIASAVVGLILSALGFGGGGFATMLMLFSMTMAALGIGIWTVVINFFAAQFDGKADFDRAFAAVTLIAVPGLVGNALSNIPLIGWLISIGLGVYSAILLYRIIPVALAVPEHSRTMHYVISLICSVIAGFILSMMLSGIFIGNYVASSASSSLEEMLQQVNTEVNDEIGSDAQPTGLFGSLGKSAEYLEQAESDRYTPPDNGKITRKQVSTFVSVMDKTESLQSEYAESFEKFSDNSKEQSEGEPGLGDVFKAISGAANIGFSEMKVVKTGGLNWAEHQWVKQQLDIARIQKDISDSVEHNYALYLEFEDGIKPHL